LLSPKPAQAESVISDNYDEILDAISRFVQTMRGVTILLRRFDNHLEIKRPRNSKPRTKRG
jgi:hypothetical protein